LTRKEDVKTTIPWELHIALIKLQANEESSFRDVCVLATKLLEPNSKAYQEQIQKEIFKDNRSRIMSSVNKSKKTWREKGRKQGYNEGYRVGYQKGTADNKITYGCSICGKELVMMPEKSDHIAMKGLMKQAGWPIQLALIKPKKRFLYYSLLIIFVLSSSSNFLILLTINCATFALFLMYCSILI
jgi:hypothetical protein